MSGIVRAAAITGDFALLPGRRRRCGMAGRRLAASGGLQRPRLERRRGLRTHEPTPGSCGHAPCARDDRRRSAPRRAARTTGACLRLDRGGGILDAGGRLARGVRALQPRRSRPRGGRMVLVPYGAWSDGDRADRSGSSPMEPLGRVAPARCRVAGGEPSPHGGWLAARAAGHDARPRGDGTLRVASPGATAERARMILRTSATAAGQLRSR